MATESIEAPKMAICITCPFYFPPRGECRANPPTAVLHAAERFEPTKSETGEILGGTSTIVGPKQPTSYFPPQRPDSWCGFHPMRRNGERYEEFNAPPPPPPVNLLKGIT